MKTILTLLAVAVLISSCKKDKEQPHTTPAPGPLTDFLYLPVKDATWKIHTQGVFADPNDDKPDPKWITPGNHDSALHTYYTITSTGDNVYFDGLRYYVYDVEISTVYTRNNTYNSTTSQKLYLREDSTYQRIYSYIDKNLEEIVVDFAEEEIGDEADVPKQWPASYISDTNAVVMNGQSAKMWEVAYHYDKYKRYFYKSYGLGRQTGMIPRSLNVAGSEPVSLQFIYKGESNKFDFDVHQ